MEATHRPPPGRGCTGCDAEGERIRPAKRFRLALPFALQAASDAPTPHSGHSRPQTVVAVRSGVAADSRTTFVNARMADLLGYSAEETLGLHLSELMNENWWRFAGAAIGRRLQDTSERLDFQRLGVKFRRQDGSKLWAHLSARAIVGADGSYQGARPPHRHHRPQGRQCRAGPAGLARRVDRAAEQGRGWWNASGRR